MLTDHMCVEREDALNVYKRRSQTVYGDTAEYLEEEGCTVNLKPTKHQSPFKFTIATVTGWTWLFSNHLVSNPTVSWWVHYYYPIPHVRHSTTAPTNPPRHTRYLGNGQTKPWFPLNPSGFRLVPNAYRHLSCLRALSHIQ